MTQIDEVPARMAGLGELVKSVPDDASPEQHERGKQRLISGLAAGKSHSRRGLGMLAMAAGALLFLLGGYLFSQRRPAALSYEVTDGVVSDGGYIRGIGSARARLAFTDGTRVDLADGSRGRVAAIDERGARIALESGRAALRVVHRAEARWFVDAGPFVIRVTGTEFDVTWSSVDETLEVTLHQGAVVVSGPPAPSGVMLRAGQRLTAREGQLSIGPLTGGPAPPAALPSAGLLEAPGPEHAGAAPAASSAAVRGSVALNWTRAVATGDYKAVLAEAENRGLASCYAGAPLSDLVALADAARYAKRSDVANAALEAQRSRFPGSAPANTAAFLLGRLADDAGNQSVALGWYDRYLREAPAGPLAQEAMGRKMISLRSSDATAARAAATEYLRRYPDGPYHARARELTATKRP